MYLKFEPNTKGTDHCIGDIVPLNNGDSLTILEYRGYNDVLVKFHNKNTPKDYVKSVCIKDIRKGSVYNPYFPIAYGVGYMGVGEHVGGTDKYEYRTWRHMLERVHKGGEWYKGCRIADEWYNYQNFAGWLKSEMISDWELDKDILSGEIYSETTCLIIPRKVNVALIGVRDINSGVYFDKSRNKYQSYANIRGERVRCGRFDTWSEAKQARNSVKSKYLLELAEEYSQYKFSKPLVKLSEDLMGGVLQYVR